MDEENQKLIDALKNKPEEGTAISILKEMGKEGLSELIIKEEKTLLPRIELNRKHKFNNIQKFCSYIENHKSENTVLYFDVEAGLCHAVIDEYETDGNAEIVTCEVLNKKLFDLIGNIERINASSELLTFVKNNKKHVGDFLTFYQVMSQLKVSSSVEKLDIQGKSSEYSVIVKAEVKGVVKGGAVDLPNKIDVIFNDFNFNLQNPLAYLITADIYYQVKKDADVLIEIKVDNKEELRAQMVNNYFGSLEASLPQNVLLVFGTPCYELVKRYGRHD